MAEITPIRPTVAADTGKPDAECIEALEALLERAKAGEIAGFAMAGIGPQGSIFTIWKGASTIRETAGAVGYLHHRFFSSWHESPG